jgi:hypothetical protein
MTITRAQLREAIEAGIASATRAWPARHGRRRAAPRRGHRDQRCRLAAPYPSEALPGWLPGLSQRGSVARACQQASPRPASPAAAASRIDSTCAIERILDVDLSVEAVVLAVSGLMLRIIEGSILDFEGDAIVNAANSFLNHGGGLAKVIANSGQRATMRALRRSAAGA